LSPPARREWFETCLVCFEPHKFRDFVKDQTHGFIEERIVFADDRQQTILRGRQVIDSVVKDFWVRHSVRWSNAVHEKMSLRCGSPTRVDTVQLDFGETLQDEVLVLQGGIEPRKPFIQAALQFGQDGFCVSPMSLCDAIGEESCAGNDDQADATNTGNHGGGDPERILPREHGL
jgi:hypothetical protein